MAEAAKTQDAQQSNVKAGASASLDPKMRPVKNRLVEYFVTVGIGGVGDPIIPIQDPGMAEPIREFKIIGGKEATPPHYEKIATTMGGRSACFLKKGYFGNGYYLCYSRTVKKIPISQMIFSISPQASREWERVGQALPQGDDKTLYLDYARQTQYPPLCDVCMINHRAGEQVPVGFDKLEPIIGDTFFICIRRAPETILGLRFQSHVLMRFPEEDYVDNPLNLNVAIFCQPEGAQLRQEPPMPSSLSFVLTDAEGKMMYASAITFYEQMTSEQAEPFREALLSPCQVIVENAGEPTVNGTYLPDGSHDGVPMFCKRIESDAVDIVRDVVLFRQKSVENHQRYWWLIGRELSPENGALVGQKDLYCVNSSEDRPPTSGWMRLESAKSPAPSMTVETDEGAVRSGYIPSWPKHKGPLYQPKTICILSRQPFFDTFRSALTDIYRISMSNGNTPLERYIVNICQEIPVPVPGRYEVSLHLAHQPIIFRIPSELSLPLLDINLSIIFRSLNVEGVIKVWQALLLEQKAVVFSSNLSLITATFEGLCALLLPFRWQFTYVPVLPYVMIGIEDAPMPVFVGMHKSRLTPEFYDESRSIVSVDLDTGVVHVPKSLKLPELPSSLQKQLLNDLRQYGGVDTLPKFEPAILESVDCPFMANSILAFEDTMFDPTVVRACFLKFFIHLLGPDFTTYLLYPQHLMDDNLFNKKAFLSDSNRSYRKFLSALLDTENTTFMRFCEDLTYTPVHDLIRVRELNFYKKCCDLERKHMENPNANESILSMLQKRDKDIELISVMKVNRDNLPENYEYQAESGFCNLNSDLFTSPREPQLPIPMTLSPIELSPNDKALAPIMDSRGRAVSRQATPTGAPENSDLQQARQAIVSVYGCWFALQAAVIESHSDPNLTLEEMLENLTALQNPGREGGSLPPDEQIYKSCLVVCGKFRRQDDAQRLFAEMKENGIHPSTSTYGAYTNALASSVNLTATPLSMGTFNTAMKNESFETFAKFDEYIARRRNSQENPKPKSKRAKSLLLKRGDKKGGKVAPHSHDSKLKQSNSNDPDNIPDRAPRFLKQSSEPALRALSSIDALVSDNSDEEPGPVIISGDPGEVGSISTEPLAKGSPKPDSQLLDGRPSQSLEVIPSMNQITRKHSLDLPERSPSRKRSSSAPRFGRGRSHSPHALPSSYSEYVEDEEETARIHWESVRIDNTCICESCGALLSDAHIMAGWDMEDLSSRTAKCVYCETEFIPWMRIEYEYEDKSEEEEVDENAPPSTPKKQRVQNEYLSPIVLRRELTKALGVSKYEFMSLKKFRENHATIFWNMLWYIFLTQSLRAECLVGKKTLTLRFQAFDSPRRCIYPLDEDVLKNAVKSMVIAMKKKDIKNAISLWHKYRSEEPEEHLMRFKSLWEHPIVSGLNVLNRRVRTYKTKQDFRKAFAEGCKGRSDLNDKDIVIPERVSVFRSIFGIPPLHIPRLVQAAKDD